MFPRSSPTASPYSFGAASLCLRTVVGRLALGGALAVLISACGLGTADVSRPLATRPEALVRDGVRNDAFVAAEAKTQVPRELLMAVAYQAGRFERADHVEEAPVLQSIDPEELGDEHGRIPRHGVMYLTDAQVTEGAALTGRTEAEIKADVGANVMAAAALIAQKREAGALEWDSLKTFRGALDSFHGLDESPLAAGLAHKELHDLLRKGFEVTTADGEVVGVAGYGEPVNSVSLALNVGQYPPIQQIPAYSGNYSGRQGGTVKFVVVHDMEGFMPGAIGAFQNPNRKSSAHYLTRASDGHIVQMVPESLNAWHCGNSWYNRNSIGIEHEGFAGRPNGGGYYTMAQYQASANLVAAIVVKYGIPIDRAHIFGHGNVPSSGTGPICSDAQANKALCGGSAHHWDPGPTWNWALYLDLIAKAASQPPLPPPTAPACGALASGGQLTRGQSLVSCNGKATLVHQGDGNVVVYDNGNGKALWSTGTNGKGTSTFAMQGDGNLVLYGAGALWSTGTNGRPGAILVMQDDGNLVMYGGGFSVLWSTGTQVSAPPPPPPPPPPANCGILGTNAALDRGQSVTSCDGRFVFVHQGDGNVVLYQGGTPLWHTHTNGRATTALVMQGDGNLVLYNGGSAVWASGTNGVGAGSLHVQNDGNTVLYAGGRARWATNTAR